MFYTNTMSHPDEYWQSVEPAYKAVYGNEVKDMYLPWEWSDEYRLRNTIYPMYLSLPLRLAKELGYDSNQVVRTLPYLAHLPVVIINDIFLWKLSKRLVNKNSARLGFAFFFANRFQTHYMIRTLTNAIEQMFTCVAFYFYLDQKNKFNLNTVILTALITISFMIRNTSPVGWVPLLGWKVLKEGSLLPFIISGIFVALPIIFICVWVDTVMYGANEWVFTGYNFLEMNLLHGLSKTFGHDPWWHYYVLILPLNLNFLAFCIPAAYWYHYKQQQGKGLPQYFLMFILFYMQFFSMVAHKEERFLLPAWSFLLIILGEYFTSKITN